MTTVSTAVRSVPWREGASMTDGDFLIEIDHRRRDIMDVDGAVDHRR
jgi:hypothetical protein